MIALLLERGQAIKNKKSDAIKSLELFINAGKDKQYEVDIIGAFITFERDKDVMAAIIATQNKLTMFGKSTKMT